MYLVHTKAEGKLNYRSFSCYIMLYNRGIYYINSLPTNFYLSSSKKSGKDKMAKVLVTVQSDLGRKSSEKRKIKE